MKNTIALAAIMLGAIILYSAISNKSIKNVIRMVIGLPEDESENGVGGNVVKGEARAVDKDRPGYKDDQLEKNTDGSWKRDENGFIVLKPGAVPFDPAQAGVDRGDGFGKPRVEAQ